MKVPLTVTVRHRFGDRCQTCGRISDVTTIRINQTPIKICLACQDRGVSLDFEMDVIDKLRGEEAKKRIKRSRMLEQQMAQQLDGRRQPGSGNTRLAGYGGDVRVIGKWRIEHKFTDSIKSYTLKLADLTHILEQARSGGEHPALVLLFRKLETSFVILPYEIFREICDELKNNFRLGKTKERRPRKVEDPYGTGSSHPQD